MFTPALEKAAIVAAPVKKVWLVIKLKIENDKLQPRTFSNAKNKFLYG